MLQCSICQKEFKSERALAGHRSSHFRFESYKDNRKKVADLTEQLLPTVKTCSYCGKEFSNGWRLGGHKVKCSLNPNSELTIYKLTKEYKNIKLNLELITAQNISHIT